MGNAALDKKSLIYPIYPIYPILSYKNSLPNDC